MWKAMGSREKSMRGEGPANLQRKNTPQFTTKKTIRENRKIHGRGIVCVLCSDVVNTKMVIHCDIHTPKQLRFCYSNTCVLLCLSQKSNNKYSCLLALMEAIKKEPNTLKE